MGNICILFSHMFAHWLIDKLHFCEWVLPSGIHWYPTSNLTQLNWAQHWGQNCSYILCKPMRLTLYHSHRWKASPWTLSPKHTILVFSEVRQVKSSDATHLLVKTSQSHNAADDLASSLFILKKAQVCINEQNSASYFSLEKRQGR